MPFLAGQMDEYVRQLGMHEAAGRPCVARSLTYEETRAWDRRDMAWRLAIALFFMAMLAWAGQMSPDLWPWYVGGIALIGAVLAFTGWEKGRRRRGYRDPQIQVEVGDDGVTFAGRFDSWQQSYAELELVEILSTATKSGRSFDGILLAAPFGPVRLEDQWFRDGRATAGAVLKRLDELGLAKPAA